MELAQGADVIRVDNWATLLFVSILRCQDELTYKVHSVLVPALVCKLVPVPAVVHLPHAGAMELVCVGPMLVGHVLLRATNVADLITMHVTVKLRQ